ncbi:hypothetical protein WME73_36225 [Sorangium sp. So ce302]|uniref:hypothetical protein n=1 Tax=Sorangium sp. So ce302 TaxID=3133297 RepID=UPI003F606DDA
MSDGEFRRYTIRHDSPYVVQAPDGEQIPLPHHRSIQLPAAVTVAAPAPGRDFYYVTMTREEYAGFLDEVTDKIFRSPPIL